MTFSIGQNFFNNLLESSDNTNFNDKKAIEQTYLKQKRLNDFWVNNDIPVLLKSQKFGGMVDLLGNKEPLGGHINLLRCGTRNAPGSCINGCPDEYPFWGETKETKQDKEENLENINQVVEQPKIIEKFTVIDQKENFMSGNTSMIVWIVIIVVLLLLGFGVFLYFTRK